MELSYCSLYKIWKEKLGYYFYESIASIGHTLNSIRVNVNQSRWLPQQAI